MPAYPITSISNNIEAKCPTAGGLKKRYWIANYADYGVPTYDDGTGDNNLITGFAIPAGSLYKIEAVEGKNTFTSTAVNNGATRMFTQVFTSSLYFKDSATLDKIRALIQSDNLVVIVELYSDTADNGSGGNPRFVVLGNSFGLSTRESADANTQNIGMIQTDDTGFTISLQGLNSCQYNYFRSASDSTYAQDLAVLTALEA